MNPDFAHLTQYAKSFASFTPEDEILLKEMADRMLPHLQAVTDDFYGQLTAIPETQVFLEGRVEILKQTHEGWVKSLFTADLDEQFTEQQYKVGLVHVKVELPTEFMSGGMTLINSRLIQLVFELYGDEPEYTEKALKAINAVTGFSLLIMQQSYQEASLLEELERFLKITGMSRVLFNNLAAAYKTD